MIEIALGYLLLALLILAPNPLSLLLWGYFTLRMLRVPDRRLKHRYFLVQGIGILLIFGFTYWHRTQLTAGEQTLKVLVSALDIQVEGDQLTLKGQLLGKRWREVVPIFYRLKSAAEQQTWQSLTHSVVLTVKGEIQAPQPAMNWGAFDYREYLHSQNIIWILQAKSLQFIAPATGISATLANLTRALQDSFATLASAEVRHYIQSLFFNDRTDLAGSVLENYQVIGLIHLFSISGFHVNLLVSLLKRLCLSLGMLREHFEWLAMILLLLYGLVLGWPYGMIRAVGDYTLPHVLPRQAGTPSALTTTSLSMLLILIVYPLALFSLSFQLSYALAFLLRFMGQRPLRNTYWAGMILSFQCVLVTIPFLVARYHTFSWVVVFFGQWFAGVFTLVLMPLLLIIMVSHWLGISHWFYVLQWVATGVIQFIEWGSRALASVSLLEWRVGTPALWVMGVFSLALLGYLTSVLTTRRRKQRRWLLCVALVLLWGNQWLDPCGQVMTLAVGQGDTHYIELPHQQGCYLIDACETLHFQKASWQQRDQQSVAKRHILPSLKAEGCHTLDGIFITHADRDHIGALAEIMRSVPTKRLYLPIGMKASAEGRQLVMKALKTSCRPHVELIWLATGDEVALKENSTFTVLAPDHIGAGTNEDSLVLYGRLGPKTFLFTGDSVGESETKVAQQLVRNGWHVDILKVAHHGSDHSTGTAWLEQVKPAIAFISVGQGNRYGHPGQRVLADLTAHHVPIYRTDTDGAIRYRYFHGSWWIKTVQ